MSTGASREAPVDNGCSSTVLTTRNPGIPAVGILARLRRLSLGTLGTENPEKVPIGSWAYVPLGTLGTLTTTENHEKVAIGSWA